MDDQKCIKGCIRQDRQAQKLLYDRYAPLLYAQCIRLVREDDLAKDALQETFIKIFTHLSQYRGDSPLIHWMRRICTHTAIKVIRKYRKIQFVEEIEPHEAYNQTSQNDFLEDLDAEYILEELTRLPHGYQLVFNLYEIEGYSHKEIAELLDIDAGTSRSQLFKAKKMLQHSLNKVRH